MPAMHTTRPICRAVALFCALAASAQNLIGDEALSKVLIDGED
jgi:hypothetical protein